MSLSKLFMRVKRVDLVESKRLSIDVTSMKSVGWRLTLKCKRITCKCLALRVFSKVFHYSQYFLNFLLHILFKSTYTCQSNPADLTYSFLLLLKLLHWGFPRETWKLFKEVKSKLLNNLCPQINRFERPNYFWYLFSYFW